MKFLKQKKDLSLIDITLWVKFRKVMVVFLLLSNVVTLFFLTYNGKPIYFEKIKEVVVRDTTVIRELIVLKHGLTEIKVDRNANIPTFCNNPGALRPSSIKEVNELAIGTIQAPSGEFLHFANERHGYKALEIVLKKVYWDKTIKQCIEKYAPKFENNTDSYISKIASKLNVSPNTLIKNVDLKKLMLIIAEIEGFKQIN
jgi:hypothetical protein